MVPPQYPPSGPEARSSPLVPIPISPKRSDTRSQESRQHLLSLLYGVAELSTSLRGCGLQSCLGDMARRKVVVEDRNTEHYPPGHRKWAAPEASLLGLPHFTSSVFLTSLSCCSLLLRCQLFLCPREKERSGAAAGCTMSAGKSPERPPAEPNCQPTRHSQTTVHLLNPLSSGSLPLPALGIPGSGGATGSSLMRSPRWKLRRLWSSVM